MFGLKSTTDGKPQGPVKIVVAAVAGMAISVAGVVGIMNHEGVKQTAYKDPIGVVTVCVGHTKTAKLGTTLSYARCQELLTQDLAEAQADVRRSITNPVTQGQYDALVSLAFNIGGRNLYYSTLAKKFNQGDCYGAAAEFSKWIKAGGKVLPGLVKRRADERKAFEPGCAIDEGPGIVSKSTTPPSQVR